MKPQAILCDRDGTLIEDGHFLADPEKIQWLPGIKETLAKLKQLNTKVLVISNQSGVARGYFDRLTVEAINCRMGNDVLATGGHISDFYYCPHYPQGEIIEYSCICNCRKPAPGMFIQAIKDHSLEPSLCWTIGDRLRDLEPGLGLGMRAFLVKTGYGNKAQKELAQCSYGHQVTVLSSLPEIFSFIN